jgi:hypothetical protein
MSLEDAMNRKKIALVLALAVSVSTASIAATVNTGGDVRGILSAQGYLTVSNIQQKDNVWTADATAPGTRHVVRVQVDSQTGLVSPANPEKSPLDILQSIQAAGYTRIGPIRFYGGVWTANAISSTGAAVSIKIDPSDGRVIAENPH